MFVAIIGTRFSGKTSIENYLISLKGFISVRIIQSLSHVYELEEKIEVQFHSYLRTAAYTNGFIP